jgi:uncharacterized C2H2 Zn-finger protein
VGPLTDHVKRWHQVAKEVLSPLATTARTLFQPNDEDNQASTQGNSAGEVNSPKVVSEGRYQCGVCDDMFESKAEVDNHIKIHDKATNAASILFDNDEEAEKELTEVAKAHEARTEEIQRIGKLMTIDKIVDAFVDMAFKEMNPAIVTPEPQCEECVLKDQVFANQENMLDKKDGEIVEKTATIAGMSQKVKIMTSEKTDMLKKLKETENLKKTMSEKNKEISNLRAEVKTKDGLLAMAKQQQANMQTEVQPVNNDEIVLEAEVKRCKKCKFTAPNLLVLALHIENDHQLDFDCNECGKKFPFKNQLKIHRREVHEEGSFACFVCNAKFRTHKDLKQHIQKRCKSDTTPTSKTIVHKHNEDIHKQDEHRCPKCPKITNNQISLVHHLNTMHIVVTEKCETCGVDCESREVLVKHISDNHSQVNQVITEKCDTCGLDFESREVLIKHIVDHHTQANTTIISRFICKVCNVEVHGDLTKNNHMCRKPQWSCTWCKYEFYSSEARKKSYL